MTCAYLVELVVVVYFPILADAATYVGIVALGHAVMRLVAGPASEDRLRNEL